MTGFSGDWLETFTAWISFGDIVSSAALKISWRPAEEVSGFTLTGDVCEIMWRLDKLRKGFLSCDSQLKPPWDVSSDEIRHEVLQSLCFCEPWGSRLSWESGSLFHQTSTDFKLLKMVFFCLCIATTRTDCGPGSDGFCEEAVGLIPDLFELCECKVM